MSQPQAGRGNNHEKETSYLPPNPTPNSQEGRMMKNHTIHEIKNGLGTFTFYGTEQEADEIRRGILSGEGRKEIEKVEVEDGI